MAKSNIKKKHENQSVSSAKISFIWPYIKETLFYMARLTFYINKEFKTMWMIYLQVWQIWNVLLDNNCCFIVTVD